MVNQPNQKIHLNVAGRGELETLPGIDRKLARRIVIDRRRHGLFKQAADLARVRGLSQELINRIVDYVTVEGSPATAPQLSEYISLIRDEERGTADKPIVLMGSPDFLHGAILLRNDGERLVRSVVIGVENPSLKTSHGLPLQEIRVPIRLQVGQQMRTAVSLGLDPRTPPGSYPAVLVVGRERHQAVLHVAEKLSIRVEPTWFILPNIPGSEVEKRVFVTNVGNLPVTIDDLGAVGLEDENLECRVARNAVRKLQGAAVSDRHPDLDTMVAAITEELDQAFAQIGPLRVRTKNKPVEILSGDTAYLDLLVQLPTSVHERRRYRGLLHLFDAALVFFLHPPRGIVTVE